MNSNLEKKATKLATKLLGTDTSYPRVKILSHVILNKGAKISQEDILSNFSGGRTNKQPAKRALNFLEVQRILHSTERKERKYYWLSKQSKFKLSEMVKIKNK